MVHRSLLTTSGRRLATALLVSLVGCGDGTDGPTQPLFNDTAAADIETGTPVVAAGAGSGAGLDRPVGTEPGFVGSPYTASTFPLSEMQSVLPADAIPSITDPEMVRRDQVDYLSDSDLVFGVVVNDEARAYPHNIGWWHEIVNDRIDGYPVSVTFCPLTGTGLVFDGKRAHRRRLELGVSGLLYNSNLVMFDREDESLYPQIYAAGVHGAGQGQTLSLMPVVETTWGAWKQLYPNTLVIANGPYSQTRYTTYPYGDYRTNDSAFLFRIRPTLRANGNDYAVLLPAKDRVLGVRIDAETRAYPFDQVGSRRVVNDVLGGQEIVVVYDAEYRLAIPYWRRVGDRVLTFDIVDDGSFPFSIRDVETETLWDIKGRAVDGELEGLQLTQVPAHNSMWFAWVNFWPNTSVWHP